MDETTLTATVKDPSNHPVAGITVTFTMPQDVAANFTLENNGIAITQANGEAHVTLKGKKRVRIRLPQRWVITIPVIRSR